MQYAAVLLDPYAAHSHRTLYHFLVASIAILGSFSSLFEQLYLRTSYCPSCSVTAILNSATRPSVRCTLLPHPDLLGCLLRRPLRSNGSLTRRRVVGGSDLSRNSPLVYGGCTISLKALWHAEDGLRDHRYCCHAHPHGTHQKHPLSTIVVSRASAL